MGYICPMMLLRNPPTKSCQQLPWSTPNFVPSGSPSQTFEKPVQAIQRPQPIRQNVRLKNSDQVATAHDKSEEFPPLRPPGSLPKSNWSSPLRLLDLSYTGFSGKLPTTIGNLRYLNVLNLDSCHLEGSIPESFFNLTRIITLISTSKTKTHQQIQHHPVGVVEIQTQNQYCSDQVIRVIGFEFARLWTFDQDRSAW